MSRSVPPRDHQPLLDLTVFWDELPQHLTKHEAGGLLGVCKKTHDVFKATQWIVPTVLVACEKSCRIYEYDILTGASFPQLHTPTNNVVTGQELGKCYLNENNTSDSDDSMWLGGGEGDLVYTTGIVNQPDNRIGVCQWAMVRGDDLFLTSAFTL